MKLLDFAIRMENEGVEYYTGQANLHPAGPLNRIFRQLAIAEQRHADLLTRHAAGEKYSLSDESLPENEGGVFAGLGDFRHDLIESPGQLEAYRFAITLEELSVDLYQGMLTEVISDLDRTLLEYLVAKEKEHLALFNELEVLLNRPVEWVESAEFGPFGPRKEY